MLLAGKVEKTPRDFKDIVIFSHEIIYQEKLDTDERKEEVYEQQKELVKSGEELVLSTLNFDLTVRHPHKPLVEAIKKHKVAEAKADFPAVAHAIIYYWLVDQDSPVLQGSSSRAFVSSAFVADSHEFTLFLMVEEISNDVHQIVSKSRFIMELFVEVFSQVIKKCLANCLAILSSSSFSYVFCCINSKDGLVAKTVLLFVNISSFGGV